jgi:hypothetical protein
MPENVRGESLIVAPWLVPIEGGCQVGNLTSACGHSKRLPELSLSLDSRQRPRRGKGSETGACRARLGSPRGVGDRDGSGDGLLTASRGRAIVRAMLMLLDGAMAAP